MLFPSEFMARRSQISRAQSKKYFTAAVHCDTDVTGMAAFQSWGLSIPAFAVTSTLQIHKIKAQITAVARPRNQHLEKYAHWYPSVWRFLVKTRKQDLHEKQAVTAPAKALFNNANVTHDGEEIIHLGRRCQDAFYMTNLQS